jgi:hypothetical protein
MTGECSSDAFIREMAPMPVRINDWAREHKDAGVLARPVLGQTIPARSANGNRHRLWPAQ